MPENKKYIFKWKGKRYLMNESTFDVIQAFQASGDESAIQTAIQIGLSFRTIKIIKK